MIRYEIEKRLINGELDIDDLPDAWDDMYEHIWAFFPRSKARSLAGHSLVNGCLGYFPTYTLGNLYSAQLLRLHAQNLEGDETLEDMWRRGEFAPLLDWMRTNVHGRGSILLQQN